MSASDSGAEPLAMRIPPEVHPLPPSPTAALGTSTGGPGSTSSPLTLPVIAAHTANASSSSASHHHASHASHGSHDLPHASPASAPTLCLTSMPLAWLRQLVLELDPDLEDGRGTRSCLGLFQSCRVLRDLVLSECNTLVDIRVPRQQDAVWFGTGEAIARETAAATAKLLLACKLSSKVKLKLNASPSFDAEGDTLVLMSHIMATAGQLKGIIHVTLMWFNDLDVLVPSWLEPNFLNVTSLQLLHCHHLVAPIAPDTLAAAIPECHQLEQVQLRDCELASDAVNEALTHWQRQLQALPGLTSFGMVGYHRMPHWEALPAMGAQITRLDFQFDTVNDQRMEMLLGMPRLKRVMCSRFELQHSYSKRPCAWAHLQVQDIDITVFDCLPLDGLQRLAFHSTHVLHIRPSADVVATNRVVGKLCRIGVQLGLGHVEVNNRRTEVVQAADSACVAALVPLLATCRVLLLANVKLVTGELLTALRQHLVRCTSITFSLCAWCPDALPLVLPSLPAFISAIRISDGPFTEAELAVVCGHACRPICVEIHMNGWQQGWRERVQAAMAAQGQQHVTLAGI